MMENLILGIDLGTTSVKVVVVNADTQQIIAKQSKDTQSNVPSDQGTDGNKQDVPKIISALNTCVAKLSKEMLCQIKQIGICGQMHGVMLWNNEDEGAWERIERDGALTRYDVVQEKVSALYTWQDNRCDSEFLRFLPKPNSHLNLCSGYGIATLFWMTKYRRDKIKKYNCAATVQDFAVAMLCNLKCPVMSVQNAASWGYFDCIKNEWNKNVLESVQFPVNILPNIKKSGEIAGYLEDNWHSIPKGTPIGVALGDLQCSVLGTIENLKDAVLNISTSAQLAFVVDDFQPPQFHDSLQPSSIEYIPYFDDKYLAVAASLNGGNALAAFVKMLQQWTMELGFSVPQSKIWEKLLALGIEDNSVSNLEIRPTILGERYQPNLTGCVTNIDVGNLGLGQVFRALCNGLIKNLHSMMPRDILAKANVDRIVGNGSGLSRNKVLQKEVQNLYKLPLVFTDGGDAAKGAALALATINK